MRLIPNVITVSRILAAIALLLFAPFSGGWLAIYAWCGVSDALDGPLARKLGAATPFGARLDSVADFVFSLTVAIGIIPVFVWEPWMIAWMVIIVVVRMAALVVCLKRFGTFGFLHTWANKITGAVVFVAIAFIPLVGLPVAAAASCIIATFASVEELVVMARMRELDWDRKGLFIR